MSTRTRAAAQRAIQSTTTPSTTRTSTRTFTATTNKKQNSVNIGDGNDHIQAIDSFTYTTKAPHSRSAITNSTTTRRASSRTRHRNDYSDSQDDDDDDDDDDNDDDDETTQYSDHKVKSLHKQNTATTTMNNTSLNGGITTNPSLSRQYVHPSFQTPSEDNRQQTTMNNTAFNSISSNRHRHDSVYPQSRFDTTTTSSHARRQSLSGANYSTQQQQQQQQQQYDQQSNSSTNSTTIRPTHSSSSSFAQLSIYEQIKKSLNNVHLRPLYIIISLLLVIILFLFFIIITNRHVLTLPLISPQRISPQDPLLLTNGQFLTEKDLYQLQQRFLTHDILQADQLKQTNKILDSMKQDKINVIDTIDLLKANLPIEFGNYLDKTVQLNDKLNKKYDFQSFQNFKEELMLELMELNRLIDVLQKDSQNDDKNMAAIQSKIDSVEKQIEMLQSLQGKMNQQIATFEATITSADGIATPTTQDVANNDTVHNTKVGLVNTITIDELIKDVKLNKFVTNLISTQINTFTTTIVSLQQKIDSVQKDLNNTDNDESKTLINAKIVEMQEQLNQLQHQLDSSLTTQTTTKAQLESITALQTIQKQHNAGLVTLKDQYGAIQTKMFDIDGKQTQLDDKMNALYHQFTTLTESINNPSNKDNTDKIDTEAVLAEMSKLVSDYIHKKDIANYFQFYLNADQTGMIDYAHSTYGTTITAQSLPYQPDKPSLFPFVNFYKSHSLLLSGQNNACVDTILNEIQGIGDCFVMAGRSGFVTLLFTESVYISHVSFEHISPTIDQYPDAIPRHIAIYGIDQTDGREEIIAEVEYKQPQINTNIIDVHHNANLKQSNNNNQNQPQKKQPNTSVTKSNTNNNADPRTIVDFIPTVQTFKVSSQLAASKPYQSMKVEIRSNYGNKDFTNLYRIRVHGKYQAAPTPTTSKTKQ